MINNLGIPEYRLGGSDRIVQFEVGKTNGNPLNNKDRDYVLDKCPQGAKLEGTSLSLWVNNLSDENNLLEEIGNGGFRLN